MGHWKYFSSGSIADESTSVDCDRAESNGQEIGENLEGIELGQAKVKPKGLITTIDPITQGIIVDDRLPSNQRLYLHGLQIYILLWLAEGS